MALTHFHGVPAEDVIKVAPLILPLLKKPIERMKMGRYYRPEDVIEKCLTRHWQCWVAWSDEGIDAVFITYIEVFPTGHKTLTIFLIGGNKIKEWYVPAWTQFKAFAKEHDCQEIIGMGRKGWVKTLNNYVDEHDIEDRYSFAVNL